MRCDFFHLQSGVYTHKIYTPGVKRGTWKLAPGRVDSYWKPSFSGSMLNFGGGVTWIHPRKLRWNPKKWIVFFDVFQVSNGAFSGSMLYFSPTRTHNHQIWKELPFPNHYLWSESWKSPGVSGLLCRNVFVDPLQDRRWFSSSDSPQTKMQTSWVAPQYNSAIDLQVLVRKFPD